MGSAAIMTTNEPKKIIDIKPKKVIEVKPTGKRTDKSSKKSHSKSTDKSFKEATDNSTDKPTEELTDKPTEESSVQATDKTAGEPTGETIEKTDNNYFQAIGVLSGKLIFDAGFKIELAGKQYNVKFKNPNLMYFVKLGEVSRFAVYPKITHFPKRDEAAKISFEIVAIYSDSNSNSGLFEQLQDSEFLLRGLWQFIPVCRTPVVSVLHNYNDELIEKIARLDSVGKCRKLKAQHLPLLWKPPIVPAFRYQKDAETQDAKYFISIKAKLDLNREEFIFDSLVGMPTTEAPRGFVVGKKMKAEALQVKKERAATKK